VCTFTSAVKLSTATSTCPIECVTETASGDKLKCDKLTNPDIYCARYTWYILASKHACIDVHLHRQSPQPGAHYNECQSAHACMHLHVYVCMFPSTYSVCKHMTKHTYK